MFDNKTEASEDTAKKPPSSPRNVTSEDGSATTDHAPLAITTAPSGGRRANRKNGGDAGDEEPLIDLTARLELRSKKTSRLKKRQNKKLSKPKKPVSNFLDLPTELLQEIISHIRPSDVFILCRVSQSTRAFIQQHESTLAREIISARYSILSKCFPPPVLFSNLPESVHAALLSPKRQEMLTIHKKPYQHVQGMDPHQICTCMTCVFAWNNLCMVVDLAHWQKSLDRREPIPMIGRGQTPEWNRQLIAENAKIVECALTSPLLHAAILERHLRTTSSTILRRSKYTKQRPVLPEHRAYQLSYAESEDEADAFLARKGPPSYEFPYHRDNYYNVEAYVPNRKWSKDEEKWLYYHGTQHERDLEWVVARFGPEEDGEKVGQSVAELSKRLQGGLIAY